MAFLTYVMILMSTGSMDRSHALAIAEYAAQEASPVRSGPYEKRYLNPCANSRMGEGLLGVAGILRKQLHKESKISLGSCIPVEIQVQFLLDKFPVYYPVCANKFFKHNDLDAIRRCWGRGKSR